MAQAIARLTNHDDANGRFQPFGTTAVKAYDVMSTVMLPQAHKIYMTTGDFLPSPHATFLGFQLDGNLDPVTLIETVRDQSLAGTPGILQSLNDYVQARLAYEIKDYGEAERLLRKAVQHANDERANGADPAWPERKAGALRVYNYVLARLLALKSTQGLGKRSIVRRLLSTEARADRSAAPQSARSAYSEAMELFAGVIKDPAVLPYQRALAEYHYGLAELKFKGARIRGTRLTPEAVAYVNDAVSVFRGTYQELKPTVEIKEMETNIADAEKLLSGEDDGSLKADDIDWVVIR